MCFRLRVPGYNTTRMIKAIGKVIVALARAVCCKLSMWWCTTDEGCTCRSSYRGDGRAETPPGILRRPLRCKARETPPKPKAPASEAQVCVEHRRALGHCTYLRAETLAHKCSCRSGRCLRLFFRYLTHYYCNIAIASQFEVEMLRNVGVLRLAPCSATCFSLHVG